MSSKINRLRTGIIALAVVILLVIIVPILTFSWVGVIREIGTDGLPLSGYDPSVVPQSVVDDAVRLATELYGDVEEERDDFANQLLATYSEAEGKDFIIFFNSGGWGWNLLEASPDWRGILNGVEAELEGLGYNTLLLNYQRTVNTLQGQLDELMEMANGYSSKAGDLAHRVEFLTSHISNLNVILAGESTGSMISDRTMNLLRDNPQVYSIQTGPPFWHEPITPVRTLILTDNGRTPDSFSSGDILNMANATMKSWLGFSSGESDPGRIMRYVIAPGHRYKWPYPEVYSQIRGFLTENFGIKWR